MKQTTLRKIFLSSICINLVFFVLITIMMLCYYFSGSRNEIEGNVSILVLIYYLLPLLISLVMHLIYTVILLNSLNRNQTTIQMEWIGFITYCGVVTFFKNAFTSIFLRYMGLNGSKNIYMLSRLGSIQTFLYPLYMISISIFIFGCGCSLCYKKKLQLEDKNQSIDI